MSKKFKLFSKIYNIFNHKKVAPYVFISAPVILIFGLVGYPMLRAFYVSMFDWELINPERTFVWFKNYFDLFSDEKFLLAFKNTIIFALIYVLISMVIGLLLALIVYHLPKRLANAVKTIYFLPVVISMVPVAIAFKLLLGSTLNSPINYYLSFVGVSQPVGWLTSAKWALGSVIGVTIWKNMGFVTIIYLAGMLCIPTMYYEAARIDGASKLAAFRHITMPLLRNTTGFLMVTGFIGAFQAFTQIFILTGGLGPGGSTSVLGYEIYFRGFNMYQMGSASAMGVVMFIFILIATALQLKYFGAKRIEA